MKDLLVIIVVLLFISSCSNEENIQSIEKVQSVNTKQKGEENKMMEKIPNKVITIEQLEKMFSDMKNSQKMDISKPMLWGYFFTSDNLSLLEPAKKELVKKGYRFVNIHKSDPSKEDKNGLWWLHVEKEEFHDSKSLNKRNDEFYIFANKMGLRSYDGMDVGPIQ
jgi:hypothetical protein